MQTTGEVAAYGVIDIQHVATRGSKGQVAIPHPMAFHHHLLGQPFLTADLHAHAAEVLHREASSRGTEVTRMVVGNPHGIKPSLCQTPGMVARHTEDEAAAGGRHLFLHLPFRTIVAGSLQVADGKVCPTQDVGTIHEEGTAAVARHIAAVGEVRTHEYVTREGQRDTPGR